MHLRVLSNELMHVIITASRGLMELPLQPHCTCCPGIPGLQPSRTLSGPAFLHGSFCTHCSLCQEHRAPCVQEVCSSVISLGRPPWLLCLNSPSHTPAALSPRSWHSTAHGPKPGHHLCVCDLQAKNSFYISK